MNYPTIKQIETATSNKIIEWYSWLPLANTDIEEKKMMLIVDKFLTNGKYPKDYKIMKF